MADLNMVVGVGGSLAVRNGPPVFARMVRHPDFFEVDRMVVSNSQSMFDEFTMISDHIRCRSFGMMAGPDSFERYLQDWIKRCQPDLSVTFLEKPYGEDRTELVRYLLDTGQIRLSGRVELRERHAFHALYYGYKLITRPPPLDYVFDIKRHRPRER